MLNFCKNPYFKCTLFCYISGGENYKIYVVAYEQFVGFLGVQLTSVLYTVRVQDPVNPGMELEPDTKAFKKEIDKMNIQGKQYRETCTEEQLNRSEPKGSGCCLFRHTQRDWKQLK